MLEVYYIKRSERETEYRVQTGTAEFQNHIELEEWLAYNRAYLLRLEFTGFTDNREVN